MRTIHDVPYEILSDIIERCYHGSKRHHFRRLGLVCKAFHQIVQPMSVQHISTESLSQLISYPELCRHVKKLELAGSIVFERREIHIVSLMENLQHLYITMLQPSNLKENLRLITAICPTSATITQLVLSSPVMDQLDPIPDLKTAFPSLQYLSLTGVRTQPPLPPSLKKLSLLRSQLPPVVALPSLIELNITTPLSIADQGSIYPSSLEKLSLKFVEFQAELFPPISELSQLHSLSLKFYHKANIRDPGLYYNIPPSVEVLDIDFQADGCTALMHALLGGEELEGLDRKPTGAFIEPLKEYGMVDVRKREKACVGLKRLIVRGQPGRWNDLVKMIEKLDGVTLIVTN